MRRFLHWLTGRLSPPRIIMDRDNLAPYQSRWYLRGAPTMADGSPPFDASGAPKPDAIWPGVTAIHLHRFHKSDDAEELHSHPWEWALALILSGGYVEERRGKDDVVTSRFRRPGQITILRATDFHRVDLLGDDSWSLFVAGPKSKGWGFWNRVTKVFTPWRQFIEQKRGGTT